MLDTLNSAELMPFYGYIMLIAFAYLNGYLIREIGIMKLIAFLFLTASATELLIDQNDLTLTIPYLVVALIAYYHLQPNSMSSRDFKRSYKRMINRFKEALGK